MADPTPTEKTDSRIATHRSKGVVERNLPRWFRGRGFKPWEDFVAFLAGDASLKSDAELSKDHAELVAKGDEATPKGLQRLIKHYNRKRKFKKEELAPPWLFVEGTTRQLPADDAWTIEVAVELDRNREKDAAERPKDAAPSGGPALQDGGSFVAPPANDKQWAEALRRLPQAARLLCDGRGKNPSELNDRRRLAIKLNEIDRDLSRDRSVPQDQRRSLIEWAAEARAKDLAAVKAEAKRRDDELAKWVDAQVARAKASAPNMDDGTRTELVGRLRREHPNAPDDERLKVLIKAAVAASNPKRRREWAKKVVDDWNASRGSMSERVRDPQMLEQLLDWLVRRDDEEVPTDGEIYDHLGRLGFSAIRKKRSDGPRRPREPERKKKHANEEDEGPPTPAAKGKKGEKGEKKPAEKPAEPPAEKPAEGAPPAQG
jgi:hypothetical protein